MGSCVIHPCVKTPPPLGRWFSYRRKTVMSIRKVNARPTFKLSEVKVPGKTQPEKRKFRKLMTHDEHLKEVTVLFYVKTSRNIRIRGSWCRIHRSSRT